MNETINTQLRALVQKSERILLLTDERIDGDTMGSALAFFHWLNSIQKEAHVFAWKAIPDEFQYIPGIDMVHTDASILDGAYDLAVVFDCSRETYATSHLEKLSGHPTVVVIDHHASNPRFGDVNLIDVTASSTAELVWKFFKQHRITVTKDMATCLLTAIYTDTSLFSNDATNPESVFAAAELGLAGGRMRDVVRAFWLNNSLQTLRLWGVVLERLTEICEGEVAVTYLKESDYQDVGAGPEDAKLIADVLSGMAYGPTVTCILKEKAEGVRGSLRSIGRDVAEIAARFGGGGHKKAAGFLLEGASILETEDGWRIQHSDGSAKHPEFIFAQ